MKPLLCPHFTLRTDPPDPSGEEVLVFSSEGQRVVIKGHNFREFVNRVVPLLDGTLTLEEIHSKVSDQFAFADLEAALRTLETRKIVEDANRFVFDQAAIREALPQISYLREAHMDPAGALGSLNRAKIAVVGLGGVGVSAALSLVASRVGALRCIDSEAVKPADPFLTQHYSREDVGRLRLDLLRERAAAVNPACRIETLGSQIDSDRELAEFIQDVDFAISGADLGMISLTYKLNRVCVARGIPWSSATATAFEGVVGPTVLPGRTPCFVCSTMRSIACRRDPEEALRNLKSVDRQRLDRSNVREGLAFGSSVVGGMLGLEAFRYLVSGGAALAGKLLVFDFEEMTTAQHHVLRVPSCPVCGVPEQGK
jgi:bacteriocin biosynthesis cyclodehydratase domain-containing protein